MVLSPCKHMEQKSKICEKALLQGTYRAVVGRGMQSSALRFLNELLRPVANDKIYHAYGIHKAKLRANLKSHIHDNTDTGNRMIFNFRFLNETLEIHVKTSF